jgi:hypothetical protein
LAISGNTLQQLKHKFVSTFSRNADRRKPFETLVILMATSGCCDMNHIADEGDEWGSSEPSTPVMEVSEGMVLVGVIIGVFVVVILLFSLGLLIDCRTR